MGASGAAEQVCPVPSRRFYVLCETVKAAESYPHQRTVFILHKTTLQSCWQIGPKHDIQYSLHVPDKVCVDISQLHASWTLGIGVSIFKKQQQKKNLTVQAIQVQ